MKNNIRVSELFIYPVKSLAGIPLESSDLDNMGLQYDRRWMLVTPDGKFMSQRSTPKMALINTAIENGKLILSTESKTSHAVAAATNDSAKMDVVVWGDNVKASLVSKESDNWLSDVLGLACHLVYIPDDIVRQCDLDFSKEGERTGFADGFPILIVSQESLNDLNQRLEKSIDMRRFRPNIVISGYGAYEEDNLKNFCIDELPMKGVKLCSRCPMPMIDPDLGKRAGNEPMATLSTYRKWDNNIFFGMNVIHQKQGSIKVGDKLILNS